MTMFWLSSLTPSAVNAARVAVCGGSLSLMAAFGIPGLAPDPQERDPVFVSSPQALARQVSEFTVQVDALIQSDAKSAQARNAAIPIAQAFAGRMMPFSAMTPGSAAYQTALGCMTEAIYYEAANESVAGKRAVAQVILNRVLHPAYPSSVCGVIYQGSRDPVCQFSYTCDGSLARSPLPYLWRQSRDVAKAALDGHVEQSVGTATHYHADYVLPYWAYRLDKVHVEGRHIFYRFPGALGRASYFTADWRGQEFHPAFDPRRFLATNAEDGEPSGEAPFAPLPRAPTERRADNDVGGRMNPAMGWQLAIPDPVAASEGLQATLAKQVTRPEAAAMGIGSKEP